MLSLTALGLRLGLKIRKGKLRQTEDEEESDQANNSRSNEQKRIQLERSPPITDPGIVRSKRLQGSDPEEP